MTVTARSGSEQGGGDIAYVWSMEYDDVTRRVTAVATAGPGIAAITVVVQLTASLTVTVQFVRSGRAPDAGVDYPVTIGAGPTVIGPAIPPAQVTRLVGKAGSLGGFVLTESSSRV